MEKVHFKGTGKQELKVYHRSRAQWTQQISSVSPFNKGSESMVRIQREHRGPMSCFGNEIKMLDFNLIFFEV